jgi:hypothetical protein
MRALRRALLNTTQLFDRHPLQAHGGIDHKIRSRGRVAEEDVVRRPSRMRHARFYRAGTLHLYPTIAVVGIPETLRESGVQVWAASNTQKRPMRSPERHVHGALRRSVREELPFMARHPLGECIEKRFDDVRIVPSGCKHAERRARRIERPCMRHRQPLDGGPNVFNAFLATQPGNDFSKARAFYLSWSNLSQMRVPRRGAPLIATESYSTEPRFRYAFHRYSNSRAPGQSRPEMRGQGRRHP